MTATAKYEIPAHLLKMIEEYKDSTGTVLHRGVYVDTKCGTQTWLAEEGICALCDGTKTVPCQTCNGESIIVAETPTQIWDEDEERYYDEYAEAPCRKCKNGQVRCPQAPAKWCHEG